MNNKFSNNLKKIRKDNNLSQEALAEKLNVSRQAISKWESNLAYPEMEKIIEISNMFNVGIDDLLNNNISEVDKEKESKKNFNKKINDFLNFISSSVNMFVNMKFTSKIVFLSEQIIVISILALIAYIGNAIIDKIFYSMSSLFPDFIQYFIHSFISNLYYISTIIISIMIIIHLYKTRYLNYYLDYIKDDSNDKNIDKESFHRKNSKIDLKDETKSKSRIIIRDNNGFGFIKVLVKCFNFALKAFVIFILFFIALAILFPIILFVLSFLVVKVPSLFIGIDLICISCFIFLLTFFIIFLNFILSRATKKVFVLYSMISSIVLIGLGIGVVLLSLMSFNTENFYETDSETYKIEMDDKLFIEETYYNIEYIDNGQKNIKMEINKPNIYDIKYSKTPYNSIRFVIISKDENNYNIFNNYISALNDKKILIFNEDDITIKIYTNKENIKKLKENYHRYFLN